MNINNLYNMDNAVKTAVTGLMVTLKTLRTIATLAPLDDADTQENADAINTVEQLIESLEDCQWFPAVNHLACLDDDTLMLIPNLVLRWLDSLEGFFLLQASMINSPIVAEACCEGEVVLEYVGSDRVR